MKIWGDFLYKHKQELIDICTDKNVLLNEPMKNHTYYKIGGAADFFVTPENATMLLSCVNYCKTAGLDYFVLGKGSNLLISDKGFRGVIISTARLTDIEVKGETVTAYSGAQLSTVANACLNNNLTGFEFAHGIPGSVGGAVFMNAGAYGEEIKDVFTSAVCLIDGEIKTLSNVEMNFSYRKSVLSENNGVVLSAEFSLKTGDYKAIKEKMESLTKQRKEKQPLELPSCGSVFKRPVGYFAGKLIEDTGLKGYTIGGAKVSEKHCGFIVNTGDAKAEDVLNLIEYIKKSVLEKTGVLLTEEVRIIGE